MTKKNSSSKIACVRCGAGIRGKKCFKCGTWNILTSGQFFSCVKLSEVEDEKVDRLECGELGYCWGEGGIAIGTSTLIGGFPGAGKSTLLLHLAKALNTTISYIATEERLFRIKQRAVRLGLTKTDMDRITMVKMTTGEVPDLTEIVKQSKVLMLDSLNMLTEDAGAAVEFLKLFYMVCDRYQTTGLVTSHVTKGGDIAGFEALQHVVDATMLFSGEEVRELSVLKNRNGMAFVSQTYLMGPRGLEILESKGPQFQDEPTTDAAE